MNTGKIRRLAEITLGPLTVCRRLPAEAGGSRIYASAQVGGLKYLLKPARAWDAELLKIAAMLVRKNDVVWDIGANVGLFSRAASFHAGSEGKILSVEADSDAVALLFRTCRNIALGHAAITVLPVAVGASIGFVRFAIAKRARASNSIEGFGSTQTGGVREIRTLPSITLDHLLRHFSGPNVLKIDVEGAEVDVLEGSEKVLSEIRPLIYCEVAECSVPRVTEILMRNSYRIWDGADFESTSKKGIALCTANTVAIPSEKVDGYLQRAVSAVCR
jgi:FkbM family methyltransferase